MGQRFYYAVQKGRQQGVYKTWGECKAMVDGFKGAKYRKFDTMEDANAFSKGVAIPIKPVERSPPTALAFKRKRGNEVDKEAPVSTRQRLEPPPADTQIVYTDGASKANGKKHAKAGYGIFWGDDDPRNQSEPLAGERQTNQRAEATAILRVLEQTQEMKDTLEIRTDSQYCINAMTDWIHNWKKKGWKTSNGQEVQNRDLFEPMSALVRSRQGPTKFIYVRGHAGVYGNERADALAVAGAQKPTP